MNLFDLLWIILFIGALVRGYQRGLLLQAASLASFFFALWIAWHFSDDLAPVLSKAWPLSKETGGWLTLLPVEKYLYKGAAFVLLYFGGKLLFSFAVSLINQLANLPVVSLFNRTGGVFFTALQMILLTIVLVHLLQVLPWKTGQEVVRSSLLAQAFLKITPQVSNDLREWLHMPL